MNEIDLSRRSITKLYDFRSMDTLDEFTDRYIWPREQIINNESQWYVDRDSDMPNPFTLDATGLAIAAVPTPDKWLEAVNNQSYLSGLLTTRDNGHSQLFGYWEMSAMLPSAQGAWPALWLLPTFELWPSGISILSEIDIMEAVADVDEDIYHASYHTNQTGSLVSSGEKVQTERQLTSTYNRYGMSWDEDYLIWYFNGFEVRRVTTPTDMMYEPRHILLNFAVGGWGGEVNPSDYPDTFNIEYVAVYSNEDYILPPEPEGGFIEPGTPGYAGDAVYLLNDGRVVTKRDINLITEYLIQSTDQLDRT